MTYQVVGVQHCDFKSRDGAQIQGTKLHCLVECEDSDTFKGSKVETLFLSASKFPHVKVLPGDEIDVAFNRYGKVEAFTPVA